MSIVADMPFADIDAELADDAEPDHDPAGLDTATIESHLHRLMRIRAAKTARAARINELADAHHIRINVWESARLVAEGCTYEDLARIEAAAEGLMLEMRARNPRAKSVNTPYGTVSTRTTDKWAWPDDAALLNMLRETSGELVRCAESVDKAALKRAAVVKDGLVFLDGEALEGVTVESVTSVSFTAADPS